MSHQSLFVRGVFVQNRSDISPADASREVWIDVVFILSPALSRVCSDAWISHRPPSLGSLSEVILTVSQAVQVFHVVSHCIFFFFENEFSVSKEEEATKIGNLSFSGFSVVQVQFRFQTPTDRWSDDVTAPKPMPTESKLQKRHKSSVGIGNPMIIFIKNSLVLNFRELSLPYCLSWSLMSTVVNKSQWNQTFTVFLENSKYLLTEMDISFYLFIVKCAFNAEEIREK